MADPETWAARLRVSREYYRALVRTPLQARDAFRADFEVLAPLLAHCHGQVADLGGGNGLAQAYLPPTASYIALEPDDAWWEPELLALRGAFGLTGRLRVVRGVGERLPFRTEAFDVILALFSLNHAAEPAAMLAEAARILRPGGRAILALEDMEPSWADLWRGAYVDWRGWTTPRAGLEKLMALARGWPLESDHEPISESDLRTWVSGRFEIRERRWRGPYLTFDLRRLPTA